MHKLDAEITANAILIPVFTPDNLPNSTCHEYPHERIQEIFGDGVAYLDGLMLDLPIHDIFWQFLHKKALSEPARMLFGAAVAEMVLPHYEDQYPDDYRVRNCIDTIRGFVQGEKTQAELNAAHAAADAARAAAADAAAAHAAHAAADAARAAAADAAADATAYTAADAARAAADAASRDWLISRLCGEGSWFDIEMTVASAHVALEKAKGTQPEEDEEDNYIPKEEEDREQD